MELETRATEKLGSGTRSFSPDGLEGSTPELVAASPKGGAWVLRSGLPLAAFYARGGGGRAGLTDRPFAVNLFVPQPSRRRPVGPREAND